MPQPEEFFEEEEILEDESAITEEEVDEDEFVDEDEDELDFEEDSEEELSEEEEELIDEDEDLEDDEDVSEQYEVVFDSETYNQDLGGGKTKIVRPKDDKSGTNKATIASKVPFQGKAKIPDKSDFTMSEHVAAMFDGEDLSEEFKTKAVAVFEAAINERYDAIVGRLEEAYAQTIEENTEKILSELANRVNDYISYIAEEWMKENRLVVESGIKTEIAESFLQGIKDVFEQNYVQIPEEKVDLIADMETENEELKGEINERVAENMQLRREILALRCDDIFESHCDGLADTQVEKLRTLAEGIEFDSEKMFEEKLGVLKESYFSNARRARKPVSASMDLVEEVVLDSGDEEQELVEETAPVNSIMQHYTTALSRKGLKSR